MFKPVPFPAPYENCRFSFRPLEKRNGDDLVVIIHGLGTELPNHRIAGRRTAPRTTRRQAAASPGLLGPALWKVAAAPVEMALMLPIGTNWVRFAKNGAFVLLMSYP
jgi:hypothetical protein